MGSIVAENRKTLMLFSGRAFPALAEEVGAALGVEPTPTDAYEFASGEIFVRYKESVRGSDAFVIQSMVAPVNTAYMESLIMVDALKRGSAKRITMVVLLNSGVDVPGSWIMMQDITRIISPNHPWPNLPKK